MLIHVSDTKMNSIAQYIASEFQISRGMTRVMHAIYSTSFKYPRGYVSQENAEVRPAVLIREGSTLLVTGRNTVYVY